MPTIEIPNRESKAFTVSHKGDALGTLLATKNIDLTANFGKIRLAERMYSLFDSGDDGDFLVPLAFIRSNADQTDRHWCVVAGTGGIVSAGLLFKTSGTSPLTGWAQDTLTNTPTDVAYDMEIFGQVSGYDRLVVARDNDLAMTTNNAGTFSNPSWWVSTLGQAALSTSHPHQLHKVSNLLLIADGNLLHVIDDSLVVRASRIVLPKEFRIIWMADDGYRVYIGTQNMRNGEAYVFPWSNINLGGNETYDQPIPVYDRISFSGAVKDGILYTINGKGQLLGFNGNSFEEVDALPVNRDDKRWDDGNALPLMVHPNGMKVIDGNIHILLNSNIGNSSMETLEDMLAGVWEYEPKVGLYHKYGMSKYDGSTDVNWGSGKLYQVGALYETGKDYGHFLAGVAIQENNNEGSNVYTYSIQASKGSSTSSQRGYFTTPKINASDISGFWKRLKIELEKLNSNCSVIVKYRISEIRQTKNCQFIDEDTIDESSVGEVNTSVLEIGDEIEVIMGTGSGATAHISSFTEASGFTKARFNLDESISNITASYFSLIAFSNYKKLGTITDATINRKIMGIIRRSPWIQFKIELRGTNISPEINRLIAEFNNSKR